MKTLAVIKNELFKDYLRFVSTSDLPSVLDNPDIPVPFTCVESVDNQNSDALMNQLKQYFNNSKVGNKDFYTLDEQTQTQLEFMFNLIKLSSGQPGSEVIAQAPSNQIATSTQAVEQPAKVVEAPVTKNALQFLPEQQVETLPEVAPAPVVEAPAVEPTTTVVEPTPVVAEPIATTQPVEQPAPPVQETVTPVVTPVINPEAQEEVSVFAESEQDDPFGFKTKEEPVKADTKVEAPAVEPTSVVAEPVATATTVEQAEPVVEQANSVAMIDSLGIPQGATINFIKDASITATLVDEKTVNYDNQNMTLVEAAKAAFKKSGTVGMAVGLSNWNYEGETLKAWKEKQLN